MLFRMLFRHFQWLIQKRIFLRLLTDELYAVFDVLNANPANPAVVPPVFGIEHLDSDDEAVPEEATAVADMSDPAVPPDAPDAVPALPVAHPEEDLSPPLGILTDELYAVFDVLNANRANPAVVPPVFGIEDLDSDDEAVPEEATAVADMSDPAVPPDVVPALPVAHSEEDLSPPPGILTDELYAVFDVLNANPANPAAVPPVFGIEDFFEGLDSDDEAVPEEATTVAEQLDQLDPTINSQGNRYLAPFNPFAKEVTKRVDTDAGQWEGWNWRSEGDLLLNGAYFTPSGAGASASYARASSLGAKSSSSMVGTITSGAGVLGCRRGRQC